MTRSFRVDEAEGIFEIRLANGLYGRHFGDGVVEIGFREGHQREIDSITFEGQWGDPPLPDDADDGTLFMAMDGTFWVLDSRGRKRPIGTVIQADAVADVNPARATTQDLALALNDLLGSLRDAGLLARDVS